MQDFIRGCHGKFIKDVGTVRVTFGKVTLTAAQELIRQEQNQRHLF